MSRKAPVAPMLAAAIGCICFFAVLGFALPSLAAPVDSVSVPAGAQISVSGSTMSLRANGVSGTYNCSCSSQGGTCVIQQSPGYAQCVPGATKPCSSCRMDTTTNPKNVTPALGAADITPSDARPRAP